jgi:hypothetical protein
MERRIFLKTAAGAAVLNPIISIPSATAGPGSSEQSFSIKPEMKSSIHVENDQIFIETGTLTATFRNGFLNSLKSKLSGEEYIGSFNESEFTALQLVYSNDNTLNFNDQSATKIRLNQVSDQRVEIIFHSWNGDGVIGVSTDNESGDLIIEPSAFSSRPGVLACRWNMPAIKNELQLVAPFFQGIRMRLDDPLIADSRWPWPMYWEAGLAILQSNQGGFYLSTQDTHYRYKALKIGDKNYRNILGLDTEAYGPIDNNLSAGGISWRINVFEGSWEVPARRYREWLWDAYHLRKQEDQRKEWFKNIKLAISWCPGDPEILDELSKKIPPPKILLHYPDWRTDRYDQNYPTYIPRKEAGTFIGKAQNMGFHIMPHFNAIDMDPSNPVYHLVRDFQYRSIERMELLGWSWVNGKVLGVPESNETRMLNRENNVMVKIHPGLSMWRSVLCENILKASEVLNLECAFLDVTLVTQNLHNSLVDSMTSTEGMKRLIEQAGQLHGGMVLGGEGLNEITMQGLSFAQAHLFRSWHDSVEGIERTGKCDLNQVLFGDLCKIIGYSNMGGKNEMEEKRMQIHLEHGGIPTITIQRVEEIKNPNEAVKRMMEMARP